MLSSVEIFIKEESVIFYFLIGIVLVSQIILEIVNSIPPSPIQGCSIEETSVVVPL